MITKKDFLEKYNILESAFEKTELDWKQLEAIYNTYEIVLTTLEPTLNFFAEGLRRAPKVHSIKARLKDPEHLIEKIIRSKQNIPTLDITEDNYDTIITDLIGLRALHLFKSDWEYIHDWITKTWELKEKPVVNIREGDQPELIELFNKKGCDVKEHPFGYRSAHYIVACKPSKKEVIAEIQVRTIFEEGWSEIDHLIRYPYVKGNTILEQYLVMFNRLAGSADEMGSYIMYLNAALKKKELEFSKAIKEKTEKNEELQKKIGELEVKIEEMKMDHKDKESLMSDLGQISDISTSMPDYSEIMSGLTTKMPDYSEIISGLTTKIPDYSEIMSGLTTKIPDYSKIMSGLTTKMPDYSKIMSGLTPKIPDHSEIAPPTVNLHDNSPPIIDENPGGTADQKSSSLNEEDKTDNDQHKKKGQERKEEGK